MAKSLEHYVGVLEARGYTYGFEYLPHDAMAHSMGTGRSIFETLSRRTDRHPRIVRKLSVPDGINAARVTLASAWFDADRCRDGLEALRAYRVDFDERTKAFSDRPRHDWSSHSADSFRYLSIAWREADPEKPKEPVRRDSWDLAFERAERDGYGGGTSWRTA